jgi:hypothetical protein
MNHHFQTEKLDKPTVTTGTNSIEITKGANAPDGAKYTISLVLGADNSVVLTEEATAGTYDLSGITSKGAVAGQSYTISVVATATGYTDSDAVEVTYTVPGAQSGG